MFAEARAFAAGVQQRRAVAVVGTNLILRGGEAAFYCEPSTLCEPRAGGWRLVDSGSLAVTSGRLVFDGVRADRVLALKKIISVESLLDAVVVSVEGRQRSMLLSAANPCILALILRICCQAPDPRDLSHVELDVTFAE
jgi:hypothetical protein